MIKKSSIENVIDRADIVEVIGQFINLKRRGVNYLGLCPFHNEKTPSFNVNPSRGIYKCFGCGKGGDVVSFVEEYEKFSFTETIRWLADFYQIELEETETPDEFKQQHQEEESLRLINEFATDYFHQLLNNNEEGRIVGKGYFFERGFSEKTINDFRLGYCLNNWDSFSKEAMAKGYNPQLLEKAGLIKARDGQTYDNYKGRVIFPVFSQAGKVLGFGARVLRKNEKSPKYLNTPENELYVKSKVLYGLYQARQAIRKSDECFLVEGYTDVISLHQGGIENVVASSGTSLTEGQLKLLANLTKNLTILYDGDAAGIKAALRGLDMALGQSFRVRLALLPDGEDPDSFMQKNGSEVFLDYIATHRQDLIDFHLEVGLKEVGNDPIKKARLVSEIAETISRINKGEDFTLKDDYSRKCAARLGIEEQGLINLVNKFTRERLQKDQQQQQQEERTIEVEASLAAIEKDSDLTTIAPSSVDQEAQALLAAESETDWHLLKILLTYGNKPFNEGETVAQHFFDKVDLKMLTDPLAVKIGIEYHRFWQANGCPPDEQYFIKHSDKNIRHKAVDLLYEKYSPSPDWEEKYKIETPYGESIYLQEVASTFTYYELKFLLRQMEENNKKMKDTTDAAELTQLMKVHQELKKLEKALKTAVILK